MSKKLSILWFLCTFGEAYKQFLNNMYQKEMFLYPRGALFISYMSQLPANPYSFNRHIDDLPSLYHHIHFNHTTVNGLVRMQTAQIKCLQRVYLGLNLTRKTVRLEEVIKKIVFSITDK